MIIPIPRIVGEGKTVSKVTSISLKRGNETCKMRESCVYFHNINLNQGGEDNNLPPNHPIYTKLTNIFGIFIW